MASQAPGSPVHLTTAHVPAPPQTHPRSLGLPPPPLGMPRLPLQQQPLPGNTLGGRPNPHQQLQSQQHQFTMPPPAPGLMRPPPRTLGQQLALNTPLAPTGGGPPLGQQQQWPQQQQQQQQQQQPSTPWGSNQPPQASAGNAGLVPPVAAPFPGGTTGSTLGFPHGSGFAEGAQVPIPGAALPPATAAAAAAAATPEVQAEVDRLRREVAAAQQGREEMRCVCVCQGQ